MAEKHVLDSADVRVRLSLSRTLQNNKYSKGLNEQDGFHKFLLLKQLAI